LARLVIAASAGIADAGYMRSPPDISACRPYSV
jgi:hypothetical protein